jgi:glycosyltransferase involved in cell wall biosynthesis
MPRVSAIVPAYNAAHFLPHSLPSILRQIYADWEAVVVNDGSTDDTERVVESFLPAFGGRLKYVYQVNKGLPAARNTAIRQASGEFIALLDADDVWLPRRLELGVALMDRDPAIGLVHGKVERIDIAGKFLEYPPTPAQRYLEGRIASRIYDRKAHLLCPTILFRKECVARIGFFDETMRATEDRDMWFRIATKYKVGYLNEVIAQYRISASSMSRDWARMRTWQTYFIERHRASGAVSNWQARKAFGNMYRERGDAIFNAGDLREALRWYAGSLRHCPWSFSNQYMFFRGAAELLLSGMRSKRAERGTAD